jgi:hypothetical protein
MEIGAGHRRRWLDKNGRVARPFNATYRVVESGFVLERSQWDRMFFEKWLYYHRKNVSVILFCNYTSLFVKLAKKEHLLVIISLYFIFLLFLRLRSLAANRDTIMRTRNSAPEPDLPSCAEDK